MDEEMHTHLFDIIIKLAIKDCRKNKKPSDEEATPSRHIGTFKGEEEEEEGAWRA